MYKCRGLFKGTIQAFFWDYEEKTEYPVSDPKFESGPSRYEASTLSIALFGRACLRQRYFVLGSWQYRVTDVEHTQIFSTSFSVGYKPEYRHYETSGLITEREQNRIFIFCLLATLIDRCGSKYNFLTKF
jgi:hypothetical protein